MVISISHLYLSPYTTPNWHIVSRLTYGCCMFLSMKTFKKYEDFQNQILNLNEKFSNLSDHVEKMNGQLNPYRMLSTKEASKILQVTSRTLFNYRKEGILSFSKEGGKIYYKPSDLEELLQVFLVIEIIKMKEGEI